MKVQEIMTKKVIILHADDSVEKALKTLNSYRINGAPVADDNNDLIGMVVKRDLYWFLCERGHYSTCPVEWVMTRKVVTATSEDKLIDVAKRLREKNINSVPVVEGRKIVGMISFEDIIDWFIDMNEKNEEKIEKIEKVEL